MQILEYYFLTQFICFIHVILYKLIAILLNPHESAIILLTHITKYYVTKWNETISLVDIPFLKASLIFDERREEIHAPGEGCCIVSLLCVATWLLIQITNITKP